MSASFGARLRELRSAAGLSMGAMAEQIHYSKSYISKIESGVKPPTRTFAKLCDSALQAGGALADLISTDEPADDEPAHGDDAWAMMLDESGDVRFTLIDRRHILAGVDSMVGFAAQRHARPRVDKEVVEGLRAAMYKLRVLGRIASPIIVLGPVIAQTHALRALATGNPEPVRSELLLLAACSAEYAGWLSQESNDDRAALWWTSRAVSFSRDAGDHALVRYALVRRAEIALYRQDAITTVELAQRAQADPNTSPRVLGLAARCEAQGHALAGDSDAYLRALDRSADLLTRNDSSCSMIGSSSVPNEIDLARGWALLDLGQPARAAEVLDQAVGKIPDSARRARARFGARRVLAHAYSGEVDHACTLAAQVLDDAAQVDSATVRLDLRQLARTITRWRDRDAVRDLYPSLIGVLNTVGPS